jgi:two-component system sensor histidine kinase BaeS
MSALSRGGLAHRLWFALGVVLATAGVTAWLVASVVGPYIFHRHLVEPQQGTAEDALEHAEIAFRTASGLALAIAIAVGVAAALLVSATLAKRMGSSLGALAAAARDVSSSRAVAHVAPPGMGREFDSLAAAFNQMAERLEQGDGLRAQLLSDVAHELRTPVATINAYLEALEDGVEELSPETIEVLRAQGTRLVRLSQDLADVTRAESSENSLRRVPLDVAVLVNDAAMTARVGSKTTIVTDVEPGLPQVMGDRDRLLQVLGNLIANAVRHTPADGIVAISSYVDESAVVLTVSDTGEGVASEHLPHLFERFYRVDSARDRDHGGSGIGLAIVKALVEAHGGTVTAASEGVGAGTCVEISLPTGPAVASRRLH